MPSLRCYAPLASLRERNKVDAAITSDDARMLRKLRAASGDISDYCQRDFQPEVQTRTFDWQGAALCRFRGYELLKLTSFVDGYGITIDPAAMIMQGAETSDAVDTASFGPWHAVELDVTKAFLMYLTTRKRCHKVTGVWGWHDDYGNAWHDTTLTVQGGGINATATTITTSASPITTPDAWGQTPALSPGHLIQIDSEWMQVIATSTTTITVVRASNGTTGASHTTGAAISVYEAAKDIQDMTARWAAWLLRQDDTDFGHVFITPQGTQVPMGIPPDLVQRLDSYRRARVA